MKTIKVKFVDFNEGATAVNVFLQFLQERYEVEISDEPEWLLYSARIKRLILICAIML